MSSLAKLVHMTYYDYFASAYIVNMHMPLRYLFPVIFQACVCIHNVDLKDNRNIYLKGSSARTLTNFNSQKAFQLFATFIIFTMN